MFAKMICQRCSFLLRVSGRTAVAASEQTARRNIARSATQFSQSRQLSILTPRRPTVLAQLTTVAPKDFANPSQSLLPEALDVLPKISSHPALSGTQVRNGPRDTFKPSHLVRKRRHGFLARLRTRTGRAVLKRRQAKKRSTYSH